MRDRTVRDFGKVMYTLLYLKWITNKDLLYSTWNSVCSMLCANWMAAGVWGRMDTCICMTESLCFSPETITTLLTGCTPIHSQKFLQNQNLVSLPRGKEGGEGVVREFEMDMYTLLYLKWITNKDLLYSTGNSVQCYEAAWMGEEFRGERIHVYIWLSPFAVHLKLSQHC